MSANNEEINEVLANDGTGLLFFWLPEGSQTVSQFLIGVADGGGYSSVLMSRSRWEEMKAKVDELIAQHVIAPACVMCLKPSTRTCNKNKCYYPLCEKCDHPHDDQKMNEFHGHQGIEEDLT